MALFMRSHRATSCPTVNGTEITSASYDDSLIFLAFAHRTRTACLANSFRNGATPTTFTSPFTSAGLGESRTNNNCASDAPGDCIASVTAKSPMAMYVACEQSACCGAPPPFFADAPALVQLNHTFKFSRLTRFHATPTVTSLVTNRGTESTESVF
jgi:hypothetical protein